MKKKKCVTIGCPRISLKEVMQNYGIPGGMGPGVNLDGRHYTKEELRRMYLQLTAASADSCAGIDEVEMKRKFYAGADHTR